jgi:hypothetical protein
VDIVRLLQIGQYDDGVGGSASGFVSHRTGYIHRISPQVWVFTDGGEFVCHGGVVLEVAQEKHSLRVLISPAMVVGSPQNTIKTCLGTFAPQVRWVSITIVSITTRARMPFMVVLAADISSKW